MQTFLQKVINITFLFLTISLKSQILFYNDLYKGGITGSGVSLGNSNDAIYDMIKVNLNNASFIRKAFLICYKRTNPFYKDTSINIKFNNTNYVLSNQNSVSEYFISTSPNYINNSKIIVLDVTENVNSNQNNYLIEIPSQSYENKSVYKCFYLYVLYENANFNLINIGIYLNNNDLISKNSNYNFFLENPINSNSDVSLSLQTDILWDVISDGTNIIINNNNIGVIGESDIGYEIYTGAGAKSSFYYENNSLFGLEDDTADDLMYKSDALALINNYLNFNNNIDLRLETQNLNNVFNNYISFSVVYTSKCESFSSSKTTDTTLCPSSPLPLFASGGQSYTWLADGSVTKAAEVLSCTNCPNPVFTGDKSTLLTVQIWNNDSCSVVRPIKINVRPKPQLKNTTFTPTDCGTSNGKAVLELTNQGVNSFSLDGNTPQYTPVLENLSKGQHFLHIEDEYGCVADTFFNINDTLRTNAKFSFNPNSGYSPLEVNFLQQSTYAANYQWKINENLFTDLSSFTFDSSGLYNVTLYAWQFDESCIDSFSLKIKVYDNFSFSIPNIFTPNSDNKNDVFGINVSNEVEITYEIYNRWGNLVAQGTKTGKGFVALWDGTSHKMFSNPPPQSPSKGGSQIANEGTYFYTLSIELKEELSLPENPSSGLLTKNDFPIKEKGWVQVVR
ncbi:MAG: gliding motility-associated C-terminal domain-containing protein [Flavobacteriia bacterium]|nr:gliding motility-associated C-terminal domain-containing protein [Flavobacteriia bacterium]